MKIETRKRLWVSDSFTEKFGNEEITPAKTVPPFKTLEQDMNDHEIKKELGVQESTLEDVAAFLENPPEGTDDGYTNLFYVAGYVVNVCWDDDDHEWNVRAWKLDDDDWDAGLRAFSRNSSSDTLESSDTESLGLLEAVEVCKEAGYVVYKAL